MIVTRSGGHYATGSTRIDDFVQTCTMVAPTGDVVETAAIPRSGSGVDINRAVMCGGEGAFGVVTSAVLKLVRGVACLLSFQARLRRSSRGRAPDGAEQ